MTQVIQIRLRWSNAFLILGEKTVLVDSGYPGDETAILKSMADAGRNIKDLSLILHTHVHIDHCGCTAALKQKSNALAAVHREESGFFLNGKNAPVVPVGFLARLITSTIREGYDSTGIDILIDDETELAPYGIAGKIIMTPGHTPGSISVLLDHGEVIVGDLLGGGRLLGLFQPGRPRYHHWYSDLDAAKRSISRVMDTNPIRVFVGHGGPLEGRAARDWWNFTHSKNRNTV